MLIDKYIKFPCWILDDILKSFIDSGAASLDFTHNRAQDDNIAQNILFQDVNLIQDDVGVEHNVVREGVGRAYGLWGLVQNQIIVIVMANGTLVGAAP